MTPTNVFLACPLYDGRLYATTARSLFQTASRVHRVHVVSAAASLLATNCNAHWCTALNHRAPQQLKWFAMLHSDIEPEPFWLDKLIAEAEQHHADLVSAVVPMKDLGGLTSTALARPDSEWEIFCRLTMQQVHSPFFPDTFDIRQAVAALATLPEPQRVLAPPPEKSALLVNTGCFVCRLDRPWCDKVWFSIQDGIEKKGDLWQARFMSEDWVFAKRVADQGAKVMATRKIALSHVGPTGYKSTDTWGQPRDLANLPQS